MAIELSALTEKLHKDCLTLNPEQAGTLINLVNLGNTYVEVVQFFICRHSEKDKQILETVADEFFQTGGSNRGRAKTIHYKYTP